MNKSVFLIVVFFVFMFIDKDLIAQKKDKVGIEWQLAAKLQNADGTTSTGFAGAINGVTGDRLIVAGGANFPGKLPWEGGEKHYSDEIHLLQKDGGKYIWEVVNVKLPEPIAYCGNTSTPYGIVCVGGENSNGISNKAFLLNWNTEHHQLEVNELPDLPLKATNIALTSIDNIVYAAGGDQEHSSSRFFYCINLKSHRPVWQPLPRLPIALANALAIAQAGPDGTNIYIIGGRTKTPSGISDLHQTVFEYNTTKCTWSKCADISDGEEIMNLSAAAGIPFGKRFILVTGGDNGLVFHKIETYLSQIASASTAATKQRLTEEKNELNINHKGFYKGILLYNTQNNTWTKVGELPFAAHVTTTATKWGSNIILSNGEIKPGVRTPDVMLGKILINEKNAK
jgi:N-acetylneuraminate epimerase